MNEHRTVDDIVGEVCETVTEKMLEKMDAVAHKMLAAEDDVADFLRAIRGRKGMMFYMNTSSVRPRSKTLSLNVRVHGVNCGRVVRKEMGERTFTPINHGRRFSGCGGTELEGGVRWGDPNMPEYVGKAGRKAQREGYPAKEAGVQARMIRSLWDDRKDWPNQVLVTYPASSRKTTRGVPYQFPVPISARGGVTTPGGRSAGYTDLMTRKGRGRSSRLRVLELKAPDASDEGTALDQAVAYCAALECLFRRGEWFGKLLGYANPHPPQEATAVVHHSDAARRILRTRLDQLKESKTRFPGLKLSVLLYDLPSEGGFRVVEELSE